MVVGRLWVKKMDIKKKELGSNIIVNLDYKNNKEFLEEIKKLAQKHEAKSNFNKLNYSIVFNSRKRPHMPVGGWCSRVIDKDGRIREVLFIDYDDILWRLVESELKYIQEKYNLSPFYIFVTKEQLDPNGELYGNYICVSIAKKKFKEVAEILSELHCDSSYKFVPLSYRFKTWVLRLTGKGKKSSPKFKCVVGNIKKEYKQEVSQAHLETIKKVYPEIPKIKYKNLDGNHEIYLTGYLTASK